MQLLHRLLWMAAENRPGDRVHALGDWLLNNGWVEDAHDCSLGDGAVEVLVFVVPLDAEGSLATINKGLVDWLDVLVASHRSNPVVSVRVHRLVLQVQAHSVPALSDFGVGVWSHIKISIDLGHDAS